MLFTVDEKCIYLDNETERLQFNSENDGLTIDLTNVDQGTATGINADTLGGVVASEYILRDELNTEVNNVITELNTEVNNVIIELNTEVNNVTAKFNTLRTDISDNYVLKTDIDKLSNSAQIDLEGVENTGDTVLANANLLAGMTYQQIVDLIYPIGRTITTLDDADNPNTLYPWQMWERTAQGRMFIGVDETYALGNTGGEAEHTLTVEEMPEHSHRSMNFYYGTKGSASPVASAVPINDVVNGNGTIDERYSGTLTGGSAAHNNMPPYLAANIWKRTA